MLAPNAQIAALLTDRIARHHLAQGRDIWPTPRIRDFAGWVVERYEQQNFATGKAPRVLEDPEEREIWRQVVSDSGLADAFTDPGGAARAARQAFRALHEYGIAPRELAGHPGAEAQALSQWVSDFRARCQDLGALARCELLVSLAPPPDVPVPLAHHGWQPQVRSWLQAHAMPALAPMRYGAGEAAASVRVFNSFDAEIAACAHWAQACLAADPDFRAFIVIPNAALERARVTDIFDAALARERFELRDPGAAPLYAIAGGTPLVEFEPVRLAMLTLQAAVGRIPFKMFSRLLRTPALSDGVDDSGHTARLDRELRRVAPYEADLAHWLTLARELAHRLGVAEPATVQRLTAQQAHLPARGRLLMSQWASLLVTALEAGAWAGRAAWSSIAFQSAQRLRELLHTLARASSTYGPLDLAGALGAVNGAARDTPFQPQTGVAPIWISNQGFDPWLSFEGLWMSGAGAHEWPAPAQPLPLLPVPLQRRYGVIAASAADQAREASDLLQHWRLRAGALQFSCCADAAQSPRISPLLDAVPAQAGADAPLEPHWRWLGTQGPRLETFTDEAGPALQHDEVTGGVTSLKHQSRCPFQGFAATRLQTRELEEPQPGFNPMERGNILHAALEIIWRELGGSRALQALDESARDELVQRAALAAIAEAAGKRDPGRVWRRRELRRLQKLLPQWLALEAQRAEFHIQALEAAHRVQLGGIDFDVRIDRIDRLADGRLLLLDYKTGQVNSDWKGDRPDNPQLPVYALCVDGPVAAVAYARVAAAESNFRGVSHDPKLLPEFGKPKAEGSDMAGQLHLWRERLVVIADELRNGVATVTPTRHACRDCPLPGLCRIDAAAAEDGDEEYGTGGES